MKFERILTCALGAWVAVAGQASAQVVLYSETFDDGLGSAVALDDGAVASAWHFRDECPSNSRGAHSAPGAARWGNPASCDDFGAQASSDILATPAIDLTACEASQSALQLSLTYALAFQEIATYDRARIEAVIDGGLPVVVADNGFGPNQPGLSNLSLTTDAWSLLTLDLSGFLGSGTSLVLHFVGETSDGINNFSEGFLIDDVEILCDAEGADLAVTQSAEPDPARPGRLLDYRVTVTHQPLPQRIPVEYTVMSSGDLGGPSLDFEDISNIGNPIALGDDEVSGAIPVGFDFPFFGFPRSEVFVSSNGFLSFLPDQGSGCCTGGALHVPSPPNAIVAGWWNDLDPSAGGAVHWLTRDLAPNRRFIVQFTGVPHFGGALPVTFQIKLFESDGRIEIHYLEAPTNGGLHTVGIENDTATAAVPYFRGITALPAPLAVRFAPGRSVRASDVTLVDVLPVESIFSAAIPSQGECAASGVVIGETVTCSLGDLEPGESATVDISVTVPSGIELPLVSVAMVDGRQIDPDLPDNRSVMAVPIEGSGAIFFDGFESGSTMAWSSNGAATRPPAGRSQPLNPR